MSHVIHISDQLNRPIILEKNPKRIISLVPSITELLVDLGLEENIVGLTKFCVHPKELKATKTIVGGTKQVKVSKIRGLQPDLILCNKEENTREMVEELSAIASVHVSDVYSLEDNFKLISSYGQIFQKEEAAQHLTHLIKQARQAFRSQQLGTPSQSVAYFIWKDPWMVAAGNTYINSMVAEAGFKNIFAHKDRYPKVQLEKEQLQEADTIFLSSEPFPFKKDHLEMIKHKFPEKKVMIVDGEMFSWYGSRPRFAYDYFRRLKEKSV